MLQKQLIFLSRNDRNHSFIKGQTIIIAPRNTQSLKPDMHDKQNKPNHPESQENHLVRKAIAGDARAFAHLCEKYRLRVWRVAASVTRSNADADDLAQESFVRAFGAIRNYRPEASFEAWLCRIALHAAQDYQKSAWRRRVLFWGTVGQGNDDQTCEVRPAVGSVITPHQEAERREIRRRVRAAVAELKSREAIPIWLIYFEEFTLAEVARLEGEPESTVRSRVRAGLKRLEKKLGDLRVYMEPDEEKCSEGSSASEATKKAMGDCPASDQHSPPLGSEMKGRAATCP